jgi:hypothetical protein
MEAAVLTDVFVQYSANLEVLDISSHISMYMQMETSLNEFVFTALFIDYFSWCATLASMVLEICEVK